MIFAVAGSVSNETYEHCLERQMLLAFRQILPYALLFKYHHFEPGDRAFKTVFLSKIVGNIEISQTYAPFSVWFPIEELKSEMAEQSEKFAPPFLVGMKIFFKTPFTP